MSKIGYLTDEQYEEDYPLDFDSGVRGSWLELHGVKVGALIAHKDENDWVCAGAVYWVPVEDHPTWELVSEFPLTLHPSIQCSCGFHGFIRDGKWVNA